MPARIPPLPPLRLEFEKKFKNVSFFTRVRESTFISRLVIYRRSSLRSFWGDFFGDFETLCITMWKTKKKDRNDSSFVQSSPCFFTCASWSTLHSKTAFSPTTDWLTILLARLRHDDSDSLNNYSLPWFPVSVFAWFPLLLRTIIL